jgi:hypothetical protein
MNNTGPNQVRRDELKYTHERLKREVSAHHHPIMADTHGPVRARLYRDYDAALRAEELRYRIEVDNLERLITQETDANGGIDADQAVRQRIQAEREAHREAMRARFRAQRELRAQIQAAAPRDEVIGADGFPVGVNRLPPLRELQVIAEDRQNVHTAVVVAKVKKTVETVLKIVVPPEYETETLKTLGEIITECKLTKKAAWQMTAKYCEDIDIYDLGVGIYAKVLNSVWQYIKASPDAPDLKKILAAEMQDNVGMCAQGNLSRLCNILSGYLDGMVVDDRTPLQIMNARFADLMREEEDTDRLLEAGSNILREFHIAPEQWMTWLGPLIE